MPEVFVIAPFGTKAADPHHGIAEIDFDRVYGEIVRPAAEGAGFSAVRADAEFTSDSILESVVNALLRADVVVADVSLPNGNVYYELGMRHAISNGPTVLVAHRGTRFPFDIAHRRVLSYDLNEPATFRQSLAEVLRASLQRQAEEPEVRRVLRRAGIATGPDDGARFEQDLRARIERAETPNQLIAVWYWARSHPKLPPPRALTHLAKELQRHGAWEVAADVLERLVADRPDDFELRRQLGWNLRKQGRNSEAEQHLAEAIRLNESDPEARGLIGGLLKSTGRYAEAAQHYALGAKVAPSDPYMLVNLAAVEVLASPGETRAALEHYRRLTELLEKLPAVGRDVWSELMLGEAYFALGDEEHALKSYRIAAARPGVETALKSAAGQLELFAKVGFRPELARACLAALATRGSERLAPAPAVARSPQPLPVFLHISDLHFGTRTGPKGKVDMHRFRSGEWEKTLLEHLEREFDPKRGHFNFPRERLFLVVSGDLTYNADKDEFDLVIKFLKGLCKALGISPERVAIAPGNHDVNWNLAKNDPAQRFDNFLVFMKSFYGNGVTSLYPRVDWALSLDRPRPDPFDLFGVFEDPVAGIQVVVINSCVHEDDARHWGFVGGRQLERIEENLAARETKPAVRVAVFHHHLHPYPEPPVPGEPWVDLSIVRDGALLEKWLERNGFDLVLHGHKHKPQLRETVIRGMYGGQAGDQFSKPLIVCGAGSAGVSGKELEQDTPNQYQVIEVLCAPRTRAAEFVRVEWRQLAATPGAEWVTPRSWVLLG